MAERPAPPARITEQYWTTLPGNKIEGTLSVPTGAIVEHFAPRRYLHGLDVGAGKGTSTEKIRNNIGGRLTAIDINAEGLQIIKGANLADEVHVASSDNLPFDAETFDYAVFAGMMTNLAGFDIEDAKRQRVDTVSEVGRVLRPGGLVVVSDIAPVNIYARPRTRYDRAEQITGERGTVGTWIPQTTLEDMSDKQFEDFVARRIAPARLTHHYEPDEMAGLFEAQGFKTVSSDIVEARSPSGKPTDNLVYLAVKAA